MSGTEWKDLESAWQDMPASVAPAVAELKHASKWQWWSHVYLAGEVAMTLAGLGVSIWLASRGGAFYTAMASATFFFVGAAAAASWWARSQPRERNEDPILQTVQAAIRRIEVGLRMARATIWVACAALIYLSIFALAVHYAGEQSDMAKGYIAIAIALIYLSVVVAGCLVYIGRRSGDLDRLKEIGQSLKSG